MEWFLNIARGALIGVANIIPGVSGGTMAVSLGIYDRLLAAIASLRRSFKKSVLYLLPILIGCAAGIGAFSFAIDWMIANQPLVTCLLFSGFVLGGLPMLIDKWKTSLAPKAPTRRKKARLSTGRGALCALLFVAFAALVVWMALAGGGEDTGVALKTDPLSMLLLVVVGAVASATMVIPGISGSLVLMLLGYYFGVVDAIKSLLTAVAALDVARLAELLKILLPFGIGVLAGIAGVAKLMNFLFERYPLYTYSAILGLIVASPFAIFAKVGVGTPTVFGVLIGIILFVAGGAASYFLGSKK